MCESALKPEQSLLGIAVCNGVVSIDRYMWVKFMQSLGLVTFIPLKLQSITGPSYDAFLGCGNGERLFYKVCS